MKEGMFVCCLAAFACFYFTTCENNIMKKWWEEPQEAQNVISSDGTVSITGLSVQNKAYDGTTKAVVIGTPVLSSIVKGDDVGLVVGTADFVDANAGVGKLVSLNGWSLNGADADKYTLQMPILKANITKADPTVNWPIGLVAAIEQKLSDVPLPANGTSAQAGTFVWTKPSNSTSDLVGTYSYNMTFLPNDTSNYNTLTQNVTVLVVSVKMVPIAAGTYTMGSSPNEPGHMTKEAPQHKVTLRAFYMSEMLITQEVYEVVMGNNPSCFTTPAEGEPETPGKLPVERVSWYDALVFCNKLSLLEGLSPAYRISKSTDPADWGAVPVAQNVTWNAVEMVSGSTGYRLPTEAQWEYACRAGTTTAYNTGSSINDNTGWYKYNGGNKTHQVGIKPPNAWGLYDMHGNVYEWCWDRFDAYQSFAATDPMGSSLGNNRIVRGGANGSAAEFLRSAARLSDYPYSRFEAFGFRLVLPWNNN